MYAVPVSIYLVYISFVFCICWKESTTNNQNTSHTYLSRLFISTGKMYTTSGLVSISYVHAVFALPSVPRVALTWINHQECVHGTKAKNKYNSLSKCDINMQFTDCCRYIKNWSKWKYVYWQRHLRFLYLLIDWNSLQTIYFRISHRSDIFPEYNWHGKIEIWAPTDILLCVISH